MGVKTTELVVVLSILAVIVIAIVVWKVREDRRETTAEERKARRAETEKIWKDFFKSSIKSCIKWLFIFLSCVTMKTIVSIRPIWQAILPGCIATAVIVLIGYFLFKWLGIDKEDKNDK